MKKSTSANSRFKQLRVLWDVHFYVPQNILSLTENNRFRTSQLREAAERYVRFKKTKKSSHKLQTSYFLIDCKLIFNLNNYYISKLFNLFLKK